MKEKEDKGPSVTINKDIQLKKEDIKWIDFDDENIGHILGIDPKFNLIKHIFHHMLVNISINDRIE